MFGILVAIVIVSTANAALPRGCLGGYKLGTEPVRGVYWYRCNYDGSLTKAGCLDPAGRKIRVGETYTQGSYEMMCVIEDDKLRLVVSGCFVDEQHFRPGDTWQDDKFYYTCTRLENGEIWINMTGCVVNNQRLPEGTQLRSNQIIYECKKSSYGGTVLCSIGCVFEGQDYLLDTSFKDSQFKYQCTKQGGSCHVGVVACLDGYGSEYTNGQTWVSGDVFYRCKAAVEENVDSAKAVAEGCRDETNPRVPRRIGEQWEEYGLRLECRQYGQLPVRVQIY